MIEYRETHGGKVAEVSGAPSDCMLFYSVWQSLCWPTWCTHGDLGQEKDRLTKEAASVAKRLRDGEVISFGELDVCQKALDVCRKIGIDVRLK